MADLILPPSDQDTRRALLRKGIIVLEGQVSKEMFDNLASSLLVLESIGSPDVELRICSGGGNCHYGLAIYDTLRLYKGKKTGIVIERAKSVATLILQACDNRKIMRHADFLIHCPSRDISLDELRFGKKRNKLLDSMNVVNDRMIAIYKSKLKVSPRRFTLQYQKDEDMTTERALEFGFVDEIL